MTWNKFYTEGPQILKRCRTKLVTRCLAPGFCAPPQGTSVNVVIFMLLRSYQSISPGPRLCLWTFRNKIRFNREELLAPRPNPKMEDHHLSAAHDCLFNIPAATLHIGGRSSIRNLRTCHVMLTGITVVLRLQKDFRIRSTVQCTVFKFVLFNRYFFSVQCHHMSLWTSWSSLLDMAGV